MPHHSSGAASGCCTIDPEKSYIICNTDCYNSNIKINQRTKGLVNGHLIWTV